MKLITTLLAVCLLVVSVIPSAAIVDLGDPKVTRLWRNTDDGDRFTCSATWIRPASGSVSWLLTAGHCAKAAYVKRGVNDGSSAVVNWKVVITSHAYSGRLLDIAIGTAPDMRSITAFHAFIADKAPTERGTILYIHGFPAGAERVSQAVVLGMTPLGLAVRTAPGEILPGSSGSVVLDQNGFVVGVVWGLSTQKDHTVYITPIEAFHEIVKLIDAKIQGEDQ